MENEKERVKDKGWKKMRKKRKKKKEGMEWKREKKGTSALFLFFSFPFSFLFFPVSMLFLRFHSLSPFIRFILFGRLLRTHVSLMGEIQFAFFHPREMENHETQGTMQKPKRYLIRYLLYFVPILVHPNFHFFLKDHLELINLESIILEFKDLIRKFVQISINLIFV